MKKSMECLNHGLILMQHFFFEENGKFFYFKQQRCYKCRKIQEEIVPVSYKEVNQKTHIKIRIKGGK